MRKTLSLGLAAVTAAVGMLTAGEGVARDRHYDGRHYDGRYYNHRYRDRDNDDEAIAAGIVGLALGAALASGSSNNRSYYYGSGHRSRYYDGPRYRYYDGPRYGYYDRPRRCRTVRAYDPYYGRVYERRCW